MNTFKIEYKTSLKFEAFSVTSETALFNGCSISYLL